MATPYKFIWPEPLNDNFMRKKRRREVPSSKKEACAANISKKSKPDVVLVSSDEVEFPANKSDLCSASSFFRAMFGGAFREASSGRIVLHLIIGRVMKIIMDYLRLDRSKEKAFEDSVKPIVVEVYRAAHMLDLTGLVKLSCTLLGEGITTRLKFKKVFAIYDACPTETLRDFLRASFCRDYRHFFKRSCLTFDLSLIKFVLHECVPFVNHQLLVKLVFRWIRYSPKRRGGCLDELSKILRPERLPAGLMTFLAAEEEILQSHPDILQRFRTSETTVVDTVQFRRGAGYEVIADAMSALFFDTEDFHTPTTVERVSFSGSREKKVLPFKMRCARDCSFKNTFSCVQYKSKIYFVGHVVGCTQLNFIEYEFDNNSFVCMDRTPIHASYYCDAFVVGDRLYVHCTGSSDGPSHLTGHFVQYYDFLAGDEWKFLMNFTEPVRLCPYENSFLILEADGDKNATKVTSVDESSSFTLPCKHNGDDVVHYNGRLFGFSEIRGRHYGKRTFVYDVDKKCFKSNSDYKELVQHTSFMRIHSLRRHPLIVQCEMRYQCRLTYLLKLIDCEHDIALGQIESTFPPTGGIRQEMLIYCKDLTL